MRTTVSSLMVLSTVILSGSAAALEPLAGEELLDRVRTAREAESTFEATLRIRHHYETDGEPGRTREGETLKQVVRTDDAWGVVGFSEDLSSAEAQTRQRKSIWAGSSGYFAENIGDDPVEPLWFAS